MMIVQVTNANFESEVLQSTTPVLIDFYANWCMPCKMLSPIIDEIADEVEHAKICKVNVDEEPELAQKFHVMSIPTLVVMKQGQVVQTTMGVRPKKEILQMLAV
ncbi:MAG TPA: thioredoxin [Clostridiales bacterium]|nr:thioredoxin [Clostridiales bacterium]